MRFIKMQGAGNDYIYVDAFQEKLPEDLGALARAMSDRHFGVGGDGLVLIGPTERADARMRMFNADGSEAEMCGNAVRCVAKYVYEQKIARRPTLQIETGAGVLTLELETTGSGGGTGEHIVERVRVDMGPPILDPAKVPTTLRCNGATDGEPVVDAELTVGETTLRVTTVSMGNPHCVTFVDQPTDELVLGLGPRIERDPHFPQRVNVEFVEVLARDEVRQRTWERGSGETLACGTGAAAVCVAGVLSGRTDRQITVHLPGGDLELEWSEQDNHVYKTGPAVEVFRGEWNEKG